MSASFTDLTWPTSSIFQAPHSLLISWIFLFWAFSHHKSTIIWKVIPYISVLLWTFQSGFTSIILVFFFPSLFSCALEKANIIFCIWERQVDHRSGKWFAHCHTAKARAFTFPTPHPNSLPASLPIILCSASYQYILYLEGFQFQVPLLSSKLSCHNGTLCWKTTIDCQRYLQVLTEIYEWGWRKESWSFSPLQLPAEDS